jgi:hypothetical protein
VTLRLALSSPDDRGGVRLGDAVESAVREALAGTRQVAVPERPIHIAFPPGHAVPRSLAARQLAAIADVLAARNDVVVELSAVASAVDRRWLAEQRVADQVEEPGGFKAVLRAFGMRGQRTRIRDALEARAAGGAGRLGADDEAALDALVAALPPVADDRVGTLAHERLRHVAHLLAERYAVSPTRVIVDEPPPHVSPEPPSVGARFVQRSGPREVRLQ